MSAITARLSTPLRHNLIRRGPNFSTTTTCRNSANMTNTTTAAPQASGWWKNLQPSTRRNIKIGLGIAAVADAVTLEYYMFPELFGAKKE